MRLTICTLFLVALSGCEASGAFPEPAHFPEGHAGGTHSHDEDEPLESLDPAVRAASSRVLVLESQTVNQPTEVVGLIDVHEESGHHSEALERLRIKGAALGADAVLGVEFHHGDDGEPAHLSGTAVRFRDLLRGRRYDVLGELEVTGQMGDEAGALRELKRRARAVSADLILGVMYHHGEGGDEAPRLTGTAIRLR
jgi:uncharacterized protein YbjQ (UPF0145 family)